MKATKNAVRAANTNGGTVSVKGFGEAPSPLILRGAAVAVKARIPQIVVSAQPRGGVA